MSAHTPGPWVLGNENNYCCDVDCGDGRTRISFDRMDALGLNECHITREEMLANARVVAAAPDLLAAVVRMGCQDAGNCGPNEPDGRCFRCEALAKAGCL